MDGCTHWHRHTLRMLQQAICTWESREMVKKSLLHSLLMPVLSVPAKRPLLQPKYSPLEHLLHGRPTHSPTTPLRKSNKKWEGRGTHLTPGSLPIAVLALWRSNYKDTGPSTLLHFPFPASRLAISNGDYEIQHHQLLSLPLPPPSTIPAPPHATSSLRFQTRPDTYKSSPHPHPQLRHFHRQPYRQLSCPPSNPPES